MAAKAEKWAEDAATGNDVAKLRQVQLVGRRFAISIEPVYWEVLEEAARDLNLRLNHLVGALAGAEAGPGNLAARLRLFCIRRLRRQFREARSVPRRFQLPDFIEAVPSPCFAINHRRRIAHVNQAVRELVGEGDDELIGIPAEKYFRIKFADPSPDVWRSFGEKDAEPIAGSVAYMMPGRLAARRMIACPMRLRRKGQFLCIVFIR